VVDADGLKVLDVTNLAEPKPVEGANLPLQDARNLYVARTYVYVAGGKQGLAIIDVERPEQPRLDQVFNADGAINDLNDVKLGMVSSSLFAFAADGRNGLRVIQLFSPVSTPNFAGFSPRPIPKLIANYSTRGPALAVSKGLIVIAPLTRSGNQLAVFGRRGSRPFTRKEMERMFLRDGKVFEVTNEPPNLRHEQDGRVAIIGDSRSLTCSVGRNCRSRINAAEPRIAARPTRLVRPDTSAVRIRRRGSTW